ncbi:unnamed protein product [Sphenostylis stenocarpa]|uniref:Uncharacterized protein n=1 Tax=Sphenostylis stenocarpa TaxID=92480 RepID=A0AA86W267_9FABA|nr:unnamed protein product [Sphenostylis stenocarpa]
MVEVMDGGSGNVKLGIGTDGAVRGVWLLENGGFGKRRTDYQGLSLRGNKSEIESVAHGLFRKNNNKDFRTAACRNRQRGRAFSDKKVEEAETGLGTPEVEDGGGHGRK